MGNEKGRHTRRVEDQHLGLGRDGALELVKVDGPLACREGLDGAFFGGVHGHVDDLAAGHLDVADILVEKGLKDDDLIPGLDEGHEGAQHACCKSTSCQMDVALEEYKPSFAPVVMVISVSGSSVRPQNGE